MKINEDIIDIIRSMGGNIKTDNKSITFCKSQTSGIEIDVSQCPDIAPILGVLGAVSNGVTNIVNAKRLTMKESNRLLSTFNRQAPLLGPATIPIHDDGDVSGGSFW